MDEKRRAVVTIVEPDGSMKQRQAVDLTPDQLLGVLLDKHAGRSEPWPGDAPGPDGDEKEVA